MVMSTLAVKPRGCGRPRAADPDAVSAPLTSTQPCSYFYEQAQINRWGCRYLRSVSTGTQRPGINKVDGCRTRPRADASRPRAGGPLFGGRARYRRPGPFAKSRGRRCGRWRRVTPRRSSAAEAPAVAPDAPPAWAEIAATPAPGSAMPSRSASAGDRGHIGWRHRLCAHRAKRLGIVRCERDHQPQAGCCKQNGLLHALSPLISFCRPARRKALSAAKRNRSRRRAARARRLRHCTNEGCMGNGGAGGEQFCTDRRRQAR